MSDVILQVNNLVTGFKTDRGIVHAVSGVNLELKKGRTLGIVGESGCGKSVTALSMMRLLPQPAGFIDSGEIIFKEKNLVQASKEELLDIRGNRIAMIFQEPMTALNPVYKIGRQLMEVLMLHRPELSKAEMRRESIKVLSDVGIPAPEKRIDEYPHQLSGGMRQRVMIAIALSCKPDILIADEPTTALDVTIQAQILELMRDLQSEYGMSIVFITHDLGVVAEMCHDVAVMYSGKVVETGDVRTIFKNPTHPYTQGLLASIPTFDTKRKSHLETIEGMVPSLFELPQGCRFQGRCPYVMDACKEQSPTLKESAAGHFVSCFKTEREGS